MVDCSSHKRHLVTICQIPWNSPKVRNNSSRSSKVIDLGANRKHIYTFLLVTNINNGRISYSSHDIDAFSLKIACFPHRELVWRTNSGWTPCDINVTYTSLKSAFNDLQFRRGQYGSVFIHLAVIASETREMLWNSKRIWPYSSSRSSKVIDLCVNRKPICDFLLVINCNFSHICYRFQDIQA